MFLNVVACCCAKFETGQTFNPVQTDTTFLHPFARTLRVTRKLNFSIIIFRKAWPYFQEQHLPQCITMLRQLGELSLNIDGILFA